MIRLNNRLSFLLVCEPQAYSYAVGRMSSRERLDLFVAQNLAMLLEYFLKPAVLLLAFVQTTSQENKTYLDIRTSSPADQLPYLHGCT